MRTLLSSLCLALCLLGPDHAHAQQLDEVLAKVCPPLASRTLSARDQAVLLAVAEHYRQFEWSARPDGPFVAASYARHAVPARSSKMVVMLETIPVDASIEPAIVLELQRHGVGERERDTLLRSLREANRFSFRVTSVGANLVGMDCRELFSSAFGGVSKRAKAELANVSKAISFTLPAYDGEQTRALVWAVNDVEYRLEGKGDREVIFLERKGERWNVAWHTEGAARGDTSADVKIGGEDFAVFEALLRDLSRTHTGGKGSIELVNQTLAVPPYSIHHQIQKLLFRNAAAKDDLLARGKGTRYLGDLAGLRSRVERAGAVFVQREALDFMPRSTGATASPLTVIVSLPGYAGETAVVAMTKLQRNGKEREQGSEYVLLRKDKNGWRVVEKEYRRAMRAVN